MYVCLGQHENVISTVSVASCDPPPPFPPLKNPTFAPTGSISGCLNGHLFWFHSQAKGQRYEYGDFVLKFGQVSAGPSFKGLVIEVCDFIFSRHYILEEFENVCRFSDHCAPQWNVLETLAAAVRIHRVSVLKVDCKWKLFLMKIGILSVNLKKLPPSPPSLFSSRHPFPQLTHCLLVQTVIFFTCCSWNINHVMTLHNAGAW